MMTRVAVLLGLGDRDQALLDAVMAVAERVELETVWLVHADERGGGLLRMGRGAERTPDAAQLERVAALAARMPGVDVRAVATDGRAADAITRIADDGGLDLVMLGRAKADPGEDAWSARGLRILRTSDCPVLIVPNGAVVRFGSAVVGMDLSPNAVEALAVVAGLVPGVRALAVTDPTDEDVDVVDPAASAELVAELRATYAAAVAPRFEGRSAPPLDVVAAASPGDALLAAGASADLLAVGSRGLTPMAAVLLGSTAERLGGRCMVPLLVVRRRGEHRSLFGALLRA